MNKRFKTTRPLLHIQRFEIRQFIAFWKLPIYPDCSNQKTNLLRNRVRKQLMPTLRIFFNPQVDSALTNFIEITTNEQLYFINTLNSFLQSKETYPRFMFFVEGITANPLCVFCCGKVFHSKTQGRQHICASNLCCVKRETLNTSQNTFMATILSPTNRNQIIYSLVVKNMEINALYSYPNVFQRRALKQVLKTFTKVKKALIEWDKQKLMQSLMIHHIKRLLTPKEKKALLILLSKTINKHS